MKWSDHKSKKTFQKTVQPDSILKFTLQAYPHLITCLSLEWNASSFGMAWKGWRCTIITLYIPLRESGIMGGLYSILFYVLCHFVLWHSPRLVFVWSSCLHLPSVGIIFLKWKVFKKDYLYLKDVNMSPRKATFIKSCSSIKESSLMVLQQFL